MRRALLVPILLVLVAGAAGAYVRYGGEKDAVAYRTAAVERGPLTATVSAKGTLSAVNNVQVGTQVSGQIMELLVDFDLAHAGQLLARIDPETFLAKNQQAAAEPRIGARQRGEHPCPAGAGAGGRRQCPRRPRRGQGPDRQGPGRGG